MIEPRKCYSERKSAQESLHIKIFFKFFYSINNKESTLKVLVKNLLYLILSIKINFRTTEGLY